MKKTFTFLLVIFILNNQKLISQIFDRGFCFSTPLGYHEKEINRLRNSVLYVYLNDSSLSSKIIKEGFESSWKFCKYQFVNTQERNQLLLDKDNFIFEFRSTLQYDNKQKDTAAFDYTKREYVSFYILIYSGPKTGSKNKGGICAENIQTFGDSWGLNEKDGYRSPCGGFLGLTALVDIKSEEGFCKYMDPYFTAYLYRMQAKLEFCSDLTNNLKKADKSTEEAEAEIKDILSKREVYFIEHIDSSNIKYFSILCEVPETKIHHVNADKIKQLVDSQDTTALLVFDLFQNSYMATLPNGKFVFPMAAYQRPLSDAEIMAFVKAKEKALEKRRKKKKK